MRVLLSDLFLLLFLRFRSSCEVYICGEGLREMRACAAWSGLYWSEWGEVVTRGKRAVMAEEGVRARQRVLCAEHGRRDMAGRVCDETM